MIYTVYTNSSPASRGRKLWGEKSYKPKKEFACSVCVCMASTKQVRCPNRMFSVNQLCLEAGCVFGGVPVVVNVV